MDDPRHPVGPEIDDSSNPTAASPEPAISEEPLTAGSTSSDEAYGSSYAVPPDGTTDAGQTSEGARRPVAGREMVTQLQAMIDSVTVQATPIVRDVAAKAAELAAVAAERAGPLAHRAAEVTDRVGVRVAARSKEMAADLRRSQAGEQGGSTTADAGTPASTDWPPSSDASAATDASASIDWPPSTDAPATGDAAAWSGGEPRDDRT